MEESHLTRILRVLEALSPDIKSFGILTAYNPHTPVDCIAYPAKVDHDNVSAWSEEDRKKYNEAANESLKQSLWGCSRAHYGGERRLGSEKYKIANVIAEPSWKGNESKKRCFEDPVLVFNSSKGLVTAFGRDYERDHVIYVHVDQGKFIVELVNSVLGDTYGKTDESYWGVKVKAVGIGKQMTPGSGRPFRYQIRKAVSNSLLNAFVEQSLGKLFGDLSDEGIVRELSSTFWFIEKSKVSEEDKEYLNKKVDEGDNPKIFIKHRFAARSQMKSHIRRLVERQKDKGC